MARLPTPEETFRQYAQSQATQSALSGLANAGGLGGAVFGQGLYGQSSNNIMITTTDSTSAYTSFDPYKYTINIQQPIVPQVQEAIKQAKRHFSSFLDELRHEIQEWHGDLRAA